MSGDTLSALVASNNRVLELLGEMNARLGRMEENLRNETRTIADHEARLRATEQAIPALATAKQVRELEQAVEADLVKRDLQIQAEAERREKKLTARLTIILAVAALLWEVAYRVWLST